MNAISWMSAAPLIVERTAGDSETDRGAWSIHCRRIRSQAPPATTAVVSRANEAGSGTTARPTTPPCTSQIRSQS